MPDTRLTFEIQGKTDQAQSAINNLASSVSSQFGAMQGVVNAALSGMTTSMTNFAGKIPGVTQAVSGVTAELAEMEGATVEAGGALAGMGGPIGIAVIAMAAATAAAATLGKELFELSVRTAEFEGKLTDLSQQTGVGVETLSALEIVASTTGGSIETVAASLGIFQKNMEAAHDPTSKQAQLLREIGVTSEDTEVALRQAIKGLHDYGEGSTQTALALEAFGRGGKSVLAILKESHGDLDTAIKQFREMGILIGKEDSEAADAFNDKLRLLNLQVRALTAAIVQEAIPVITKTIEQLSQTVKENRDTFEALGVTVGLVAHLFNNEVKGALSFINGYFEQVRPALTITTELYERMAAALQIITHNIPTVDVNAIPAVTDQGDRFAGFANQFKDIGKGLFQTAKEAADAKNAAVKQYQAALESSTAILAKEAENQRHFAAKLETNYKEDIYNLEQYYIRKDAVRKANYKSTVDALNREQEAVNNARARGLVDPNVLQKEQDKIDLARREARNKNEEALAEQELQRKRAMDEREMQFAQEQFDLRESQRKTELQRIAAQRDAEAITELVALQKQQEVLTAAWQDRKALIEEEINLRTTTSDRQIELRTKEQIAEDEYTRRMEELSNRRIRALQAENEKVLSTGKAEQERSGLLVPIFGKGGIGLPPPGATDITKGPFAALTKELHEIAGLSKNTSAIIGDTLAGAFSQLAQGVGQAVESFVLFGSVEGGFKKFAAELIAQIASMAAVQAVYELAQGLAWTALNFFFPNPAYTKAAAMAFASAAVFGSIAGVAAVAGRAVAGDSFKQGGAAAGGGTGGFGGGGTNNNNSPNGPTIINAERSKAPIINLHLHGDLAHFNAKSIDAWTSNFKNNGITRKLTLSEGKK